MHVDIRISNIVHQKDVNQVHGLEGRGEKLFTFVGPVVATLRYAELTAHIEGLRETHDEYREDQHKARELCLHDLVDDVDECGDALEASAQIEHIRGLEDDRYNCQVVFAVSAASQTQWNQKKGQYEAKNE